MQTPISIHPTVSRALHLAAQLLSDESVAGLLEHKLSALQIAVQLNNGMNIVHLLIDHHADIHHADTHNTTILMQATQHPSIVAYLIESGCNIHAMDINGDNAPDHAYYRKQPKSVEYIKHAMMRHQLFRPKSETENSLIPP